MQDRERVKSTIKQLMKKHDIDVRELLDVTDVDEEILGREKRRRRPKRKSASISRNMSPITVSSIIGREGERRISDRIWNRRREKR